MVSDGEGRGVTDTWQDIPTSDRPTGHPSSWEAEAKELRDELAKERATLSLIKSAWVSTVEDNEALRERVAELEALVETAYIEGWQHGAVEYGVGAVRGVHAHRRRAGGHGQQRYAIAG
jgi:hypothetical protein